MTNTTPNQLGIELWIKLAALGIGPIVGLLATVFPELRGYLSAWIQPGITSLK